MTSREDIRRGLQRAARLEREAVRRKEAKEQGVCSHPLEARTRTGTPRANKLQTVEACEACGETLFRVTTEREASP